MSAIKIYVDSIEIDFVRSTLSLKKENNSFSKDFKVSHTTFPFLIIENDITKKALGPRDITSVIKTKTIACKVVELGVEYNGELQILSYLDGYRKSNLKYASAILPLLNTKIASYLPTVSVIPNESNPEPYSETSESELIGSENYPDFVRDQIFKVFPQASFQFPVVKFSNKFEGETGNGETWQSYSGNINNHTVNPATGLNTFTENSYQFNGVNGTYTVFNTNVNTPYLFLLTPLKAVFDSIGFKIKGNFTTNSFIRRLLMYSKNNNLTAVKLVPNKGYFSLAGLDWDFTFAEFPHWYKRSYLEINTAETYEIKFKLKTPHNGSNQLVKIFSRDVYGDRQQVMVRLITSSNQNDFYEGSYTYSMPAAEVGQSIAFEYFNSHKVDPSFFEVSANVKDAERDYMQMHPTIDLKRYCPDWTVATYINELKKLFNLKVDSDDIKKEITLNFNETLTDTQTPHISNKSLKVNSFDASKHTSFILKYDNDLDEAIYITRTNQEAYINQDVTFNEKITSKFNFIPHNGNTSEVDEIYEDKNGVGLFIYNEFFAPFTSEEYLNKNLKLLGTGGIYDVYHKKWLKFRLNSSALEIEGPFSDVEFSKLNTKNEIYIDNQHYRIVSMTITEISEGNNKIKFDLESVNL